MRAFMVWAQEAPEPGNTFRYAVYAGCLASAVEMVESALALHGIRQVVVKGEERSDEPTVYALDNPQDFIPRQHTLKRKDKLRIEVKGVGGGDNDGE
jgi:hypothetical protein